MAKQVTTATPETAVNLNDIKAERDTLQERINAINKALTATSPDTEFTELKYMRYAIEESVHEAQEFVKQARENIEDTLNYLEKDFNKRPTEWKSSPEGVSFWMVILELGQMAGSLREVFGNELDLSAF